MFSDSQLVRRVAAEHGTPFFLYDLDLVDQRIATLETRFEGLFRISYAMKCNPHRAFLELFRERLPSLDISSGGELIRALQAGWDPGKISFTGPAKQRWELEHAVDQGVGKVIVESPREIDLLEEIGAARSRRQDVLVRISPRFLPKGFGVNMSGRPNQFGVDEEDLEPVIDQLRRCEHVALKGFHIYSGTQCLSPEAIAENFANFIQLFERSCQYADLAPEALVFGSAFGVPYHDGMEGLDLDAVVQRTLPMLRELRHAERFRETGFYLELGRWLVGEAGNYVTSVVSLKRSRGTTIGICDGGMNHHLGACGHLGSVIHRNYQMQRIAANPGDAPGDGAGEEAGEEGRYNLVGPLCTSIDTLGHGVAFDGLEIGDLISVACSGAYGLTSSPINFISHPLPQEFALRRKQGEATITRWDEDGRTDFTAVRDRRPGHPGSAGSAATREGIVVLGTPRSGTTLLRRILNAHPRIACPGETNLLSACARFLHRETIAEDIEVGVVAGLRHAGFAEEEVLGRLRDLAFGFHRDHARRQNKPRWAEKTAFDSFHVAAIERLCGDRVHYICLLRHGLDFVSSMHELCEKNQGYLEEVHAYIKRYPRPLEAFAHCWVDLTEALLDFQAARTDLAVLLRYEDLVAEPSAEMARVLEFCGEACPPELIDQAMRSADDIGLGDWKTYAQDRIVQTSVRRGQGLSARTRSAIGKIINPTLERCGYELVPVVAGGGDDDAARRYQLGLMLGGLKKSRDEDR